MEQQPVSRVTTWLRIFAFMLLLYLFFVAIGLMGSSFKLLGKETAEALISATSNPFTGLMIGILATAVVQSSSFTTSMVVGMVSGGVITVPNAIPIIMGANIGTSVTNLIVSLGHIGNKTEFRRAFAGATVHDMFNFVTVIILLPLEIMTGYLAKTATMLAHVFTGSSGVHFHSPLKTIVKPATEMVKNLFLDTFGLDPFVSGILMILISLGLLFFVLIFIVKNMRALMLSKMERAIDRLFGANPVFAMVVGMILTAIIQSSSITTSMLVPLIAAGAMSLEVAFPITIGANIGTTITAILASLAGNVNGLIIAFVHLCFNLTGMIVVYWFKPMRKIPLAIARKLAEIAVEKKRVAFFFIIGVFYLLPLAAFGISQLFNW